MSTFVKKDKDTKDASAEGLYTNPAVHRPSLDKVKRLAERRGLDLSQADLQDVTDCMCDVLESYDVLYRLVEPKPPVKYPRTPGYRPPPEENTLNAWYVKTDIRGAESGKLLNKTVAVKDNIAVAGVPMMIGSKLIEGYIPEYDATVVTRCLDAGGHIVGKAACEHLLMSANSCTNDIAPVLNPHDKTHTSGGSSSGSCALVAAGEVDLAIGNDQVGWSWSGVVGLKPTFGLVPFTGAASMEPTLDILGPMALTVKDCALLLEVIAGEDGMDDRQKMSIAVPEYSKKLKSDLSGFKIGVVKEGFENCDSDVVDIVKAAGLCLQEAGATVTEINVPLHATYGKHVWIPTCMEGSFDSIIEKAGAGPSSRGFHSTTLMDHQHRAVKLMPNSLSRTMKLVTLFGDFIKEENNYHFYGRSSNLMMTLTAAYDAALTECDVLVMPTTTFKAPKLPTKEEGFAKTISACFGMCQNSAPFNGTGHPALSINAGMSGGLPVGLMVVGKKWHEQDVFNVAYAFECIRDKK